MEEAENKYLLHFMSLAIELSQKGMRENKGGPFGAVVVKDGKVVGKGCNNVTSTNDPTAHAEVIAIRDACKNLNTYQLEGCIIFTSCEPCPMCLGAIYWARPDKIYFANTREAAASIGFDDSFIYDEVSKAIKDRHIPTFQVGQEIAKVVFDEWKNKNDKLEY